MGCSSKPRVRKHSPYLLIFIIMAAPAVQVAGVNDSLQHAFDLIEQHKEVYFKYRDMVQFDNELDIPAMMEAFKVKEVLLATTAAAAPTEEAQQQAGEGAQSCVMLALSAWEGRAGSTFFGLLGGPGVGLVLLLPDGYSRHSLSVCCDPSPPPSQTA